MSFKYTEIEEREICMLSYIKYAAYTNAPLQDIVRVKNELFKLYDSGLTFKSNRNAIINQVYMNFSHFEQKHNEVMSLALEHDNYVIVYHNNARCVYMYGTDEYYLNVLGLHDKYYHMFKLIPRWIKEEKTIIETEFIEESMVPKVESVSGRISTLCDARIPSIASIRIEESVLNIVPDTKYKEFINVTSYDRVVPIYNASPDIKNKPKYGPRNIIYTSKMMYSRIRPKRYQRRPAGCLRNSINRIDRGPISIMA